MDMDGWWYDPECGWLNPPAIVYVSPGRGGERAIDTHIVSRGHCFVRMVAR